MVNLCKLRCSGMSACESGVCCMATTCDIMGASVNPC
jgi:hypothetical protein